ncbi:MAG: hypothetical protein ACM3SQ_08210 [Betaproteobacteria bacterium]
MRRRGWVGVFVGAMLALPSAAVAQSTTAQVPLARFFTELVAEAARIDATTSIERSDFLVASELGATAAQLNQSIGLQLATFPTNIGLDAPAPGSADVAGASAFAPSFAMHVGSLGSRKVSVSFSYENTSFGSLGTIGLDSNQFGFVLTPPAADQAQFGTDVLHESMSMRMQQDTATFGILYGAGSRVDVGVAIPVVHMELEGQIRSQIYHAGGASASDRHFFDVYPASPLQANGCSTSSVDVPGVNRAGLGTETAPIVAPFDMVELASRTVTRRCTASGLGDVVAYGKARLVSGSTNALGVSLGVRLPTGDPDQLLGTGTTRATASLIWSARAGRFGPHASAGYTRSFGHGSAVFNTISDGAAVPQPLDLRVPDEIDIAAGTDVYLFSRLTTSFDVFGRQISDLQRFRVDSTTAAALGPGDPAVPGTLLVPDGTGATLLIGVAAAQVALTDRTLLKGNLLFPVWGNGLMPRFGAAVGLGFRY